MKHSWRQYLAMVVLAGLTALAALGVLDQGLRASGLGALLAHNTAYLEDAFQRALMGFGTLSALKSGLAVIEGSEVGIGFNLELGDIVQSVYDYVDVAWRTTLLGATILLLTRLLLDVVPLLGLWLLTAFLGIFFFVPLLQLVAPKRLPLIRFVKETALIAAVFTISLYLLLPLSVAGAAWLSERITGPLITEAQAGFDGLQDELTPAGLGTMLEEEEAAREAEEQAAKRDRWFPPLPSFSLDDNWDKIEQRWARLAADFEVRTREVAMWTVKMIAGYLFDTLIFPFTLFFILFIFTRHLLNYLLGVRKQQYFREDLRAILHGRGLPPVAPERDGDDGLPRPRK